MLPDTSTWPPAARPDDLPDRRRTQPSGPPPRWRCCRRATAAGTVRPRPGWRRLTPVKRLSTAAKAGGCPGPRSSIPAGGSLADDASQRPRPARRACCLLATERSKPWSQGVGTGRLRLPVLCRARRLKSTLHASARGPSGASDCSFHALTPPRGDEKEVGQDEIVRSRPGGDELVARSSSWQATATL